MPNQQHRVGDDLVTDMPAMAPVLRLPLLLASQPSPLGANPLLHIHVLLCSDEFLGQLGTHELPPGLTLLVLSHASQTPSALQWEQPAI